MAQIRVNHLSFAYDGGAEAIFNDISFEFDTDWRLGFTGRNGRGKTTFLRLLMGEYEYSGSITPSVPCDYFPFPVADPGMTARAVGESIGECEPWRLSRECSLLGIGEEALERPLESLSPGERAKVLIASLFCREHRYLLLDEPTNHLDMQARRQVAGYLRRKDGFLLVSHDRAFLNRCVDHVLSLERSCVLVHKGDFTTFAENKQRREAYEAAEQEKLKREIARLSRAAGQTAAWSNQAERAKYHNDCADRGYAGHKAAKVMKRAKQMQRRSERALEEKQGLLRDMETADSLKLTQLDNLTGRLAELWHVGVWYADKAVIQDVSLTVEAGDRVVVCGPNGSGKSTLLRLLTGELSPCEGRVRLCSRLQISLVPQDTSTLTGGVRELARSAGVDESLYLAILRKLGFSRDQFTLSLSALSAGQRKKAAIARSLCEPAHLHIWDEPLNYIDLTSRQQIEELILQCRPTMVFVEHDETFCSRVATKRLEL